MTRDIPTGWKQRLAPDMLPAPQAERFCFWTNPTGGVDPHFARREFWKLIYELSETGTTVFVTTHYMDEAEYCNRLSIMHEGRIAALGRPRRLKKQYGKKTIEDVFVGLIRGQSGTRHVIRLFAVPPQGVRPHRPRSAKPGDRLHLARSSWFFIYGFAITRHQGKSGWACWTGTGPRHPGRSSGPDRLGVLQNQRVLEGGMK